MWTEKFLINPFAVFSTQISLRIWDIWQYFVNIHMWEQNSPICDRNDCIENTSLYWKQGSRMIYWHMKKCIRLHNIYEGLSSKDKLQYWPMFQADFFPGTCGPNAVMWWWPRTSGSHSGTCWYTPFGQCKLTYLQMAVYIIIHTRTHLIKIST